MASTTHDLEGKEFLVIGGTQFMGRHVVCSLRARGAHVTLLNRGKSSNPFADDAHVRHLECDRLNDRTRFRELVGAGPPGSTGRQGMWDAVIDFVCFRRKGMEDIVSQARCIRHYVFISTDSVFMACDPAHVLAQQGWSGLREDAVRRATSKEAKRAAKTKDPYQFEYGKGKLDCEFCLVEAARQGFVQYTILRLPDVIGPWDNIASHLRVQETLESGTPVGVKIKAPCGRISLAGAGDVAQAVIAVVQAGSRAYARTLHIACTEQPTFAEYVRLVAAAIGKPALLDEHKEAEMVTVDVGPICNGAALDLIAWQPTPLPQLVQATVEWYQADTRNRRYHVAFDSDSSSSSSAAS